jgi:hypothetical protein
LVIVSNIIFVFVIFFPTDTKYEYHKYYVIVLTTLAIYIVIFERKYSSYIIPELVFSSNKILVFTD